MDNNIKDAAVFFNRLATILFCGMLAIIGMLIGYFWASF